MIKKMIYTFLIATVFCSSLCASTLSQFMKPNVKKGQDIYPSFSGRWEGSCISNDGESFEKMEIFQDDRLITIIYGNGFVLSIRMDGYTRLGFQKQQEHVEGMLHAKWSDDALQLLVKGICNMMSFVPKTEMVTLKSNMSLQLKGEQLVITSDNDLINPSINALNHEVCTMARVN